MKSDTTLSSVLSSQAAPLRPAQARRLHLAAQGLLRPLGRRPRPADVVAAVERMRLLQIDSIHVVARSPYLVLHARLGDYDGTWLDQALAQGRIAECWAHEACFVPAADLPSHRAWRERGAHWAHRHAARMHREHRVEMDGLLERIRAQGAVRAADFPRTDRGASGWWEWKPEKRWLEAWFALGELMVPRRERFQRVYDLAERVLTTLDPPFVPSTLDTPALRRRFILDSVRALGITQARWIADYYRLKPGVGDAELAPLVAAGELLAVPVQGWNAPGYVHPEHGALLDKARTGQLRASHTALLSPFDPLVWDRARAQAMFDFEYAIECYTPAPKRRYGYYVLPILHRGDLVGRLDAKAHRTEGVFEIKALFLEPGRKVTPRLVTDVGDAIARTARWHGTPAIRLMRSEPAAFGRALRVHWKASGAGG
ncbi:MAG TPA: crosslink repair DNA glycosylase YcaQ family protein [Frateuria sp.]|uniref:winged helix-turn-helix domain-containing protein n=1 Tax=Frateuria sp. TaxID=2211372 RepID=UPI002D80A7EC|nr:crosslink repair DNA glycosylase YcaQ family protein [Frateuria sp.]HET6807004.1 crosslink repair DNA glycosylase YcaQ family protein [Frateuria sp.]